MKSISYCNILGVAFRCMAFGRICKLFFFKSSLHSTEESFYVFLKNGFSLLSLMSGLAALDAKCSSRLGIMTISYYLWTTFVAVVVGIVMVIIIHPGGAAQKEDSEDSGKPIMSSADALLDLIR